jgi:hypothetical protein
MAEQWDLLPQDLTLDAIWISNLGLDLSALPEIDDLKWVL